MLKIERMLWENARIILLHNRDASDTTYFAFDSYDSLKQK